LKGKRMIHGKSTQSKLSRYLLAALIAGGVTGVALGGCSSSEEKRRASSLAGGCALNSDCEKYFICCFERCHVPCVEDRDCEPDPLRCVKSEESGIFVCQLEDEVRCEVDKDCPGEQKCGVDGECRDACQAHDDCIGDQVCANSNECASVDPDKDTLDPEGNIIPDDPPPGSGSGGTGGAEGASSQGGKGGTEPVEPTAGTGGTEPVEMGGAGGMPGGGDAGSGATSSEGGGPSYPPAEYEERPGVAEVVDNDASTSPVVVTESANLYLAGDDQDWLSYTAPDDGRAHLITIHIDQEPNLSGNIKIHAASDFTQIMDQNLGTGVTRDVYLTLASGATALLRFGRYAIANTYGMAFITLSDVPEADIWEPNNSLQAAKHLTLGQSVSGQVLDPWQAANVDASQDWFAVELAAGTATLTFSALPSEGRLNVGYAPPNSVSITSFLSPAEGMLTATKDLTVTAQTAGIYHFVVRPFSQDAIVGSSFNVKPAYYDQQYTFGISQ
jgi:hypothetical protein